MDVVDLTDSAAFGDEQEAAVAIADSAKDGETPSAAELRARTESLTSRINHIDARVAQLSAERARLDAERSTVRAQLVRVSSRGPRRDWSGGVAEFPEWGATVEHALTSLFKLRSWRPLQREVINAVLSRFDTFVVMRAGGGKSLLYMLPALLPSAGPGTSTAPGITLVVSPLISLISDQVLEVQQIAPGAAVAMTSETDTAAKRDIVRRILHDDDDDGHGSSGVGGSHALRLVRAIRALKSEQSLLGSVQLG